MTDLSCLAVGPANQTQVPASVHNLPSSIAPDASTASNLIVAEGYTKIAVGLTLTQNGSVSIQRFLDPAGTVPIGSPSVQALTAGQNASLTVNDGQLFSSFQVIVLNSANATAYIANLAIAVASDPATPSGVTAGSYQTATHTTVEVPTTSGGAVLFALNPNAKYRAIRNPHNNTAAVWLTFGINPATGAGLVDLQPGALYEMSVSQGNLYQGVVTAIADSGTQPILLTEGV